MKFIPERLKDLIPKGQAKTIAEAAKVSASALSQWASGARTPGAEELAAVANTLKVPLDYFFKPEPSETRFALREGEDFQGLVELWKGRAKRAEQELSNLRNGMRQLLSSNVEDAAMDILAAGEKAAGRSPQISSGPFQKFRQNKTLSQGQVFGSFMDALKEYEFTKRHNE